MGFLDPNSWASAFDTSAEDAAKASQDTADRALDLQRRMYDESITRESPFYSSGTLANAYMQALMTGQPASYADPRYTKMTSNQVRAANEDAIRLTNPEWFAGKDSGFMGLHMQRHPGEVVYASNRDWYMGPNGEIVEKAPMITTGNVLGDLSPAGQYQLSQGTKTLNRALASRGLSGGGQAATALGDLGQSVAAQDYSNKWGRLLDMVKIGTGASAAAGGASQAYSGALGQNALNTQNIQSNLANARSSLYNTRAGYGADTLNTGLKLYDYGKQSGWWGSGGGGDGTVYSGNDYGSGGGAYSANSGGSGGDTGWWSSLWE